MKKYRGYYIDNIDFKNEKEIDEFLKDLAIESYRIAIKLFVKYGTMESSVYCSEKAEQLVKYHGLTWEQVEEIEIDVMKEVA